ncbi:uncharacterized protein LOC106650571 [Trichogramma pretiosum]|uniref:uncharacterized protein LOC106650571 n=1 Tax=Trichogramma pretiosum TaxID=7493 RepID=UPI0006C9D53B|nr:uncharacterized protein LOC106650571 [Trichogramma pretiosum]
MESDDFKSNKYDYLDTISSEDIIEDITYMIKNGGSINEPFDWTFPKLKGSTLLHFAASKGDTKLASMLIHHGASIAVTDSKKTTPFHIAFEKAYIHDRELDQCWFRDYQFSGNPSDPYGLTFFHLYSATNQVDMLEVLLKRNCKIDMAVKSYSFFWPGFTALHFAAAFGCKRSLKFLINKNSDIRLKNTLGQTVLDLAVIKLLEATSADPYTLKITHYDYEIIEIILEKFEQDRITNLGKGLTLFHLECAKGENKSLLKKLISKSNINVNEILPAESPIWAGLTPIKIAILHKNDHVVSWLENHGAYNHTNDVDVVESEILYTRREDESSKSTLNQAIPRRKNLFKKPKHLKPKLKAGYRKSKIKRTNKEHLRRKFRPIHLIT